MNMLRPITTLGMYAGVLVVIMAFTLQDNPTTTIEFTIDKSAHVTLVLYDVLGREVQTIIKGRLLPDTYLIPVDSSGLTSGMYFYTLTANSEFRSTKKMVLLR